MGVTPSFKKSDVIKAFQKRSAAVEQVMIRQLKVLGEKCANKARSLDTYKDQTGNLRSSIGYVIYVKGSPKYVNFEQNGKSESGEAGVKAALDVANEYASKNITNYYALVVVAGMDYAAHVESMGKDVLASAEHLAENEFPKLMTRLMDKIRRTA
ncbi:HK97 gp10 family phage protein [Pedobacter panaciterrae]